MKIDNIYDVTYCLYEGCVGVQALSGSKPHIKKLFPVLGGIVQDVPEKNTKVLPWIEH